MTLVWDGFPAAGSELLAMLALADWCDDRGASLYPSIQAVADKIRLDDKQTRKILHGFEAQGYLAVVGNHFGGKPCTTREYRLNVRQLKTLADAANRQREAQRLAGLDAKSRPGEQWDDVFSTPPLQESPVPHGSPTPPAHGSLSTNEPPAEPPVIPATPAGPLAVVEVRPEPADKSQAPAPLGDFRRKLAQARAEREAAKAHKAHKLALQREALKAAQVQLRGATWDTLDAAYLARYCTTLTRNATTHTQMASFVGRLGPEAPDVAAFFLRVNDAFVVRNMHSLGLLLNGTESYRTQWATGQAMTATRAQQADKTQSNFDAAQGAKALLRARREQRDAE